MAIITLTSATGMYLSEDRSNIPTIYHSMWLAIVTMSLGVFFCSCDSKFGAGRTVQSCSLAVRWSLVVCCLRTTVGYGDYFPTSIAAWHGVFAFAGKLIQRAGTGQDQASQETQHLQTLT